MRPSLTTFCARASRAAVVPTETPSTAAISLTGAPAMWCSTTHRRSAAGSPRNAASTAPVGVSGPGPTGRRDRSRSLRQLRMVERTATRRTQPTESGERLTVAQVRQARE